MHSMGTDISHHIEYDPASFNSPPKSTGSLHNLKHLQRGYSSSIDDASTTTSVAVTKRNSEFLRKTYSMSVAGSPSDAVKMRNEEAIQANSNYEEATTNLACIAEAEGYVEGDEYDENKNVDGDEVYEEEQEAEYAEGPVEYDEACPAYYDIKREAYYYYGNVLYFDPDSECYYYYDWEQQDYLYIDEEVQTAINDDTLTYWNEDDGMYHDPVSWREECGEDADEPVEINSHENLNGEEDEENNPPPILNIFEDKSKSSLLASESMPKEGNLCQLMPTLPRRVQKSEVSAPRKSMPEKFNSGIDQFRSSESSLRNRTMDILMSILEDRSDLLDNFEKKPNGTFKIGQSKRQISALTKGTIELKALCSTDCSSASASLEHLNLVQLLWIRHNARNSAWDRSPIHAHKTFAMKTDVMIAEKFLLYVLTGFDSLEVDTRVNNSMVINSMVRDLPVFEKRFIGSQAICVIGSLDALNESRQQILGDNPTECYKSNWWYLDSSPLGTVVPREKVVGQPKGLFLNISQYCKEDPKNTRFTAQFDWPEGVDIVYKLVEGRVCEGSMYWDVLAIPFIERKTQ